MDTIDDGPSTMLSAQKLRLIVPLHFDLVKSPSLTLSPLGNVCRIQSSSLARALLFVPTKLGFSSCGGLLAPAAIGPFKGVCQGMKTLFLGSF